jgi:hypothetical protein
MLQISGMLLKRSRATQRRDRHLCNINDDVIAGYGSNDLVRGSGNDTLVGTPRDDRLKGDMIDQDVLLLAYLDGEPVGEPTTWRTWSVLLSTGLMLLLALLLSLWDTAFPVRRKM